MEEVNPSRVMPTRRRVGRRIVTAVAAVVLPLLTLWGGFALWYQIPGGPVPTPITSPSSTAMVCERIHRPRPRSTTQNGTRRLEPPGLSG